MMENVHNLMKEIDIEVQGAQRVPNTHSIIKMPKVKDEERILKAATEKKLITNKGAPMRLSADFPTETSQARRDWQEVFKVMKSKDIH